MTRQVTKILVVEDEAVVAMDIRGQLERMGYEVVGAVANASSALDLAGKTNPDLILMDIQLAGRRSGIEAAREIRDDFGVPVVFLTAFADESTLTQAKEVSPYGYIVKPFDERDLRTTIEIALSRARVDATLEQSRSELQAILDSQRQGSITVDAASRITFVSQAAAHLLGRSTEKLIGSRWQESLPIERGIIDQLTAMVQSLPNESHSKITADIEDSIREVSIEIELVADPRDDAGFIIFLYDISDLTKLRSLLDGESVFEKIIGTGTTMQAIFQLIDEVSAVDSPVLIQGETGTGKELVARAIHRRSSRRKAPFIPVNCGALTPELAASQLFGHRRGSFTGAVADHCGFFATAQGGTLFLDEIGELPAAVQPTLLRALDDRRIAPVGETRAREIDFRLLAATSRSLTKEVEQLQFRSDLYYRLSVVRIELPPLRERLEDLPILARSFLAEARAKTGKDVQEVDEETMSLLVQYRWPGNVRQLKNALEFATIRARGRTIRPEHLPPEIGSRSQELPDFGNDRDRIRAALLQTRGNKKKAAKLLGVSRSTIYRHLERLKEEDG